MSEFLRTYNLIFLSLAFILLPVVTLSDFYQKRSKHLDSFITIFFSSVMVLVFGVREFNVGTDTEAYIYSFKQLAKANSLSEALSIPTAYSTKDPSFNVFTYLISVVTNSRGYLIVLASFFVFPITSSIFRFSPYYRSLIFLGFVGLIAFPNMGINVLRVGIALSFAILALVQFQKGRYLKAFLVMSLSVLFHFSSVVIAFVYGMAFLLRKVPFIVYLFLFFVCSCLAYVNIGIERLPIIREYVELNERFAKYALEAEGQDGGFSVFTMIYNLIIISAGTFFLNKINDKRYELLLKTYVTLLCFYLLCINMPDSYRFGFYSAVLVPIVVSYPFVNYKIFRRYQTSIFYGLMVLLGIMALFRTFSF